jgi:hypothetical protein
VLKFNLILLIWSVVIFGAGEVRAQSGLQTPSDYLAEAPAVPKSAEESAARTRRGEDSVVVLKNKSLDSVMNAEATKMSAQIMKDPTMLTNPSAMNPGDMMKMSSIQTEFTQAVTAAQDSSKQAFDKEASELKAKIDIVDSDFVREVARCPKTQGEASGPDPKCAGPLSATAHKNAKILANAYLGGAAGTYAKLEDKMGKLLRHTQSRVDSVVATSTSAYTLYSFNALKAQMWGVVKSVYGACGDVSATASEETKRQFIAY